MFIQMTEQEIAYLIEVLRSHKFDLSTQEYQNFVTNSIFKLKKLGIFLNLILQKNFKKLAMFL